MRICRRCNDQSVNAAGFLCDECMSHVLSTGGDINQYVTAEDLAEMTKVDDVVADQPLVTPEEFVAKATPEPTDDVESKTKTFKQGIAFEIITNKTKAMIDINIYSNEVVVESKRFEFTDGYKVKLTAYLDEIFARAQKEEEIFLIKEKEKENFTAEANTIIESYFD